MIFIRATKGTKEDTKMILKQRIKLNKIFCVFFLCLFVTLSGAGGVAGRRFNQTLDHLGYLRERLRFSQECIGPTTSRFVLDFCRTVSSQHDDSRLWVLLPDQLDHLKAVLVGGHREAEILNDDPVVRRSQQLFCFFQLRRRIDLESLQREVLAHRETDRLFIVDDEQARHGGRM
jgi:hypothetical protein